MKETIVKVRNLTFGYDKNTILENTNLEIKRGDYIGLVGPNGSAKTTLIRLILGLLEPDSGHIELFSQHIKKFNQWDKIGYISQNAREFNSSFPATVEEIVEGSLVSRPGFLNLFARPNRKKIREVLRIVGLEKHKNKLIGNLSGGQQQKVLIARVLVRNPEIIFMDEPLVGIDFNAQKTFYNFMKILNRELGITLVMVSHDIFMLMDQVNKIAFIRNKKLQLHEVDSKLDSLDKRKLLEKIYGV
jgi:zinc transport system ATP-binding protein